MNRTAIEGPVPSSNSPNAMARCAAITPAHKANPPPPRSTRVRNSPARTIYIQTSQGSVQSDPLTTPAFQPAVVVSRVGELNFPGIPTFIFPWEFHGNSREFPTSIFQTLEFPHAESFSQHGKYYLTPLLSGRRVPAGQRQERRVACDTNISSI